MSRCSVALPCRAVMSSQKPINRDVTMKTPSCKKDIKIETPKEERSKEKTAEETSK